MVSGNITDEITKPQRIPRLKAYALYVYEFGAAQVAKSGARASEVRGVTWPNREKPGNA